MRITAIRLAAAQEQPGLPKAGLVAMKADPIAGVLPALCTSIGIRIVKSFRATSSLCDPAPAV
jgi:hypothetical protein